MRSTILLRDLKTQEEIDRVITELRRRRVGYRAIGEALGVMSGLHFTEDQVRHRARVKLRLPVDEAKRRAFPTRQGAS